MSQKFEDEPLDTPATMCSLLEELLLEERRTGSTRLQGDVLDSVSSHAVMYGILSAIRHHRPRCNIANLEDAVKQDRSYWRTRSKANADPNVCPNRLTKPLKDVFRRFEKVSFPIGEHNMGWLQDVDQIRASLAAYWKGARTIQSWYIAQPHRQNCTAQDKADSIALLSFDLDDNHLATIKTERDRILHPMMHKNQAKKFDTTQLPDWIDEHMAEIHEDMSKKRTVKLHTSKARSPATRSNPAEESISYLATQETIEPPEDHTRAATHTIATVELHVKVDSVRTLSRLFSETAAERNAKPLDWRAFLIAMEDAGFSVENSGGSVVAFVQTGNDGGRINLHRPHPVAKVDQVTLQSWGKRFNKWFHWTRNTFVAKK